MSVDTDPDAQPRPLAARRGTLRVYLGAAPGVGKTFAMLNEGQRRAERGTDVVVGIVETHGRPHTAEQIANLEVIDRADIAYRDTVFTEMNIDAVLARHPEVALVDELAHTNVPGSRNAKRWQDVREILDAGIDVISTVNIQHLESINDVVERITGIKQRETIPDEVVREAEQVELVDMTPEALRRRMAHGNIYAPEKIDAALGNYFRGGNLAALRELALLWVADQVDVALEDYRERHGITEPWETRERVVIALTGAPGTEALIRRAARIAQRAHGDMLGVHIRTDDGLAGPATGVIEQHRALLQEVGGEYHEITGTDVAVALFDFARAENATQMILGSSQRSRWQELTSGSVINRVIRLSGPIDVHVISHERVEDPDNPERRSPMRFPRHARRHTTIGPRRLLAGWALAIGGVAALTLALHQVREDAGLPTVLLAFLTLVVTTAAVGGTRPAVVAAIGSFLAANWYFSPPYYQWDIADGENVVALVVFLGVAVAVSRFVDIAARRSQEAAAARSQARTLAGLAATISAENPLPLLLDHLRTVLALEGTALFVRDHNHAWTIDASAGTPPDSPGTADLCEPLAPDAMLALVGPPMAGEDRVVLNAFTAQLGAVVEQRRLRVEAGRAAALAEANALRSALLQAVSHDFRTPLASIKASATSLDQDDVTWTDEQTSQFVSTIVEETDRLTALVANLLDMSRIQAGVLEPDLEPVPLEDVVHQAIASLGHPAHTVTVDIPETLTPVLGDATLLERAVANIIDNAVRYAPAEHPVRVEAGEFPNRVDLRIIDRGPGIPAAQRDFVFRPFQRLGDTQRGIGVGLGLAVAHGFLTATHATIEIDDTPGGGTTVIVTLPITP